MNQMLPQVRAEHQSSLMSMKLCMNVMAFSPIGPAKAKEIAARIDKPEFEGSSGRWKQRYNIKRVVNQGTFVEVQSRREVMQYNTNPWIRRERKKCKGGKESKRRLTIPRKCCWGRTL